MESAGNTEGVENKEKSGEEKLLEKFDEFAQKKLDKLKGDKDRVGTYFGL